MFWFGFALAKSCGAAVLLLAATRQIRGRTRAVASLAAKRQLCALALSNLCCVASACACRGAACQLAPSAVASSSGMAGHRQKRRKAAASGRASMASGALQHCCFVTLLLSKWSWGVLSAVEVQQMALACRRMRGDIDEPELDAVAACGAFGTSPSHTHRDLTRAFCKQLLPPDAQSVPIPYVDPKSDKLTAIWGETCVFFAQDWLHCLQQPNLAAEMELVFGISCLEHFWRSTRPDDPKLGAHITAHRNWQRTTIPITLHGDGAAYQDRDSLMTVSLSGLLKGGTTEECSLFLASYPKSATSKSSQPGEDTWMVLWRWIAWDLGCLLRNRFPNVDAYGRAWPPGSKRAGLAGQPILRGEWRCVLWALQGDMEFFYNQIKLTSWQTPATVPCCPFCHGNKSDMNWYDFRAAADWKETGPSQTELSHPLFQIPGVSLHTVSLDWLHVVDLGAASLAVANVLFDIVVKNNTPAERAARLGEVTAAILCHRPEHGSQVTSFDLKNFCNPRALTTEYPALRFLKAAEIRGMIPEIARLCRERCDGSVWGMHQLRMIDALAAAYRAIHDGDVVLRGADFERLRAAVGTFLLEYSYLSRCALDAGRVVYNVIPKCHYMHHLMVSAQWLNPRFTWCYTGEDLVGKASVLAHSCSMGTPCYSVPEKMMQKYRLAMHIQWSRR